MKKESYELASICLKTIGHPKRLEILDFLSKQPLCVGEIAKNCNLLPHVTSEHLNLLKAHGLISSNKEGRKTFYKIEEKTIFSILNCIKNRFSGA